MGEMIFSYRTSEDGTFPEDTSGFVEVDTNRTLAAGGSTTYSDASENLESNPYIEKNVEDDRVEVTFKGQDLDSTDERTMKGFDVQSVFDMGTDDGSLLWSITLENTSDQYIEFGDVGLDHELVQAVDDTVVLLGSGCICCSLQGELIDSLTTNFIRAKKGMIPNFKRVLIETTGLADPSGVI